MDALPRVTASRQLALTVLLAAVIAATYGFGVYLFPVVLPAMKHDLGFGYAQAGYITAARQAANVAMALLSGIAASRFGAARVMLAATVLSATGLACLAFVDGPGLMGVLLVALNACAAATWVPMMALIAPLIEERHQAKAIGVIGSGTNFGVLINGLMVPALMASWGWRSVWVVSALSTALLSVVIVAMFARLGRPETRVAAQPRARRPRFETRLLFSRRWMLVYAVALLTGFAGVPFITYFSAYAHDDLHLGLDVTAHAWAVVGFAGAVSGLMLGMIGDARSSARQPQRDGMRAALVSAGVLLLCASVMAASRPGVYALMIAAVAFGFSFFPLFGLLHAYVGKTSEPALAAIVCGICEASFGVGGALGNVLAGLCKSMTGSLQPVYVFAAVASVMAIGLTCFVPGVRRASSANRCALADFSQ